MNENISLEKTQKLENGDDDLDLVEFLTIRLANDEYALDVLQISEIMDCTHITKVPRTPKFLLGVINLRGSIIPILDAKQKFSLSKSVETDECIVIIEVRIDDEDRIFGLLVDSVQEVLKIKEAQIETPPKIGTHIKSKFIRGVIRLHKKFILVLNLNTIFSTEELVELRYNKLDTTLEEE